MDIQTRVLGAHDAEQYRDLRLFSFKESPFAFSESYEDEQHRTLQELKNELQAIGNPLEKFILGAFFENTLIGFVTFIRDTRTKAKHKSMIRAMYVHPEYRKQGVGSILVTHVIEAAKKIDGVEQVHLWVLHSTQTAAQFYTQLGFLSQGPFVRQDLKIGDQYIDAEYMVLYL